MGDDVGDGEVVDEGEVVGEVVGDGEVVGEVVGDAWGEGDGEVVGDGAVVGEVVGEGVTGVGEGEGFKGVLSEADRTRATPNNNGPCRSVFGSNSNFFVVKSLSAQLS